MNKFEEQIWAGVFACEFQSYLRTLMDQGIRFDVIVHNNSYVAAERARIMADAAVAKFQATSPVKITVEKK